MKDKQLLRDGKKLLPGSGLSWHKFKKPDYRILQTFENPSKTSNINIVFNTTEVSALCPLTGFPDQYNLKITYIPDKKCIESKSAKFYLGAFRDYPGFIEQIAEKIFKDWNLACEPKYIQVDITMNSRGGIVIQVIKE